MKNHLICRTFYSSYEDTCKELEKRAPYIKYPTGLSIYADFHEQDLVDMMDLTVKYLGMGSYHEAIDATNPSYSIHLNNRFVCTDPNSMLSSYSKSHSCAISWATATISAAEYSIQQTFGKSTSLSTEYLITCYNKEMGEDSCNGVSMSDLSDFLSDRGLMTEDDVNRIGRENMCDEEYASITYHFESEKIEAPNRGGLMNLVASGNPTLTLMSLNLLHLRYAANMNENDYPFTGLTSQPSVYGIVTGYDKGSEESEGWWMIDVAVTPCEHQTIKLPMKEDENNANFAGIAAYAFSIIPLKRDIVEEQPTTEMPTTEIPTTRPPLIHVTDKEYPTLDSIPNDVPVVIFQSGSYPNVPKVDLSRLTDLEEVVIEEGAFPDATVFRAYGLQNLKRIEIKDGAFPNAFNFDVADCTTATELIIGSDSFNGQPPSLSSLSSGRRLQAGGLSSVFRLYNNTLITTIHLLSGSFKHTKEVHINGMNSLEEVIIDGAFGDKHAPFSNADSFIVEETINLRNLILGDKVCQACSVYSVSSPFITNVEIGSDSFNGMKETSKNNQNALEFEMVNRNELNSLTIGKGSFSYFNSFNVNNNPNQHTMLVNVLIPFSRRLQSATTSSTTSTTSTSSSSFSNVASLRFDKMPSLQQVEFGSGAFSHADSLAFINAGNLTKIVFEDNTFSNAAALEFDETGIEELSIGTGCFNGDVSDEEMKKRKRILLPVLVVCNHVEVVVPSSPSYRITE